MHFQSRNCSLEFDCNEKTSISLRLVCYTFQKNILSTFHLFPYLYSFITGLRIHPRYFQSDAISFLSRCSMTSCFETFLLFLHALIWLPTKFIVPLKFRSTYFRRFSFCTYFCLLYVSFVSCPSLVPSAGQ